MCAESEARDELQAERAKVVNAMIEDDSEHTLSCAQDTDEHRGRAPHREAELKARSDQVGRNRRKPSAVADAIPLSVKMRYAALGALLCALLVTTVSVAPGISSSPHVLVNRVRLELAVRAAPLVQPLKRSVVIFESLGGTDKGVDGLRRDTHALKDAFKQLGWTAVVVKYHDGVDDVRLIEKTVANADAFVSRIDPGEWVNFSPERYHAVLEALLERGLAGFPKPDEMSEFGSKLTLVKLLELPFSAADSRVYWTRDEFFAQFPVSLLSQKHSRNAPFKRVLKRSGGALGSGVWMVSAAGISLHTRGDDTGRANVSSSARSHHSGFTRSARKNASSSTAVTTEPEAAVAALRSAASATKVPLEDLIRANIDPSDVMIHAVEAARNRKLTMSLGEFMERAADQYLSESGVDFMLDMRFLPRVADGELRLIFLGERPVRLVTRTPAAGCFSAGLESGAVHRATDQPELGAYGKYVTAFRKQMPRMRELLGMDEWPLLWTADFILDDENEDFGMTLSEINANCIGFAAHRDFADVLAVEAVNRIIAHYTAEKANA